MKTSENERRIKSFSELLEFCKEDATVNDRNVFRPGFQAMMLYRFGVWSMEHEYPILRIPLSILYKLLNIFIRNVYGIELYADAIIGRRLRIAHQSGIVVSPDAEIGDDCLIRQGVSIGRASNHGREADRGRGIRAKAPVLGSRVEVGAGAVIAGGITIGDNVVIGPNTVVLKNVPSNSIVASAPIKIIPAFKETTD